MKTRVVHVNDNVLGAIYIGREVPRRGLSASPFANPYKIGKDGTRSDVIKQYRQLANSLDDDSLFFIGLEHIAGKPLACWCRHDGEERTEDNTCHGDVLVELIQELGLEPEVG